MTVLSSTATKLRRLAAAFGAWLVASLLAVAGHAAISQETFLSAGEARTYWIASPPSLASSDGEQAPMPLVILFHGSGRDGRSQVVEWRQLAKREGFLVVGPDARDSRYWETPTDGPEMLRDLVAHLREAFPVDPRRVYLFGHSAGAGFALRMALLESQYFAAAAIHAGALSPGSEAWLPAKAQREIPLHITVGTEDRFFPLTTVRQTHQALRAAGLPVELVEIPRHDHDYYGRSREINRAAWEFLAAHTLGGEPEWETHRFRSADPQP